MKNNINEQDLTFQYITQLIAMLISPESFSLSQMSTVLDVPLSQIRQDMVALLSISELTEGFTIITEDGSPIFFSPLETDCDEFKVDHAILLKQRRLFLDKCRKKILSGNDDHSRFHLDPICIGLLNNSFTLPFWLNPMDFSQIVTQFPQLYNSALQKTLIKKNVFDFSDRDKQLASVIQDALLHNQSLSLHYRISEKEKIHVRIHPLRLFLDTDKNLIYCIAVNEKSYSAYRLDRIEYVRPLPEIISHCPLSKDFIKRLDYMWGMCDLHEAPVEIEILIVHNTSNILSKIQAETKHRKYGHMETHELFSIYTDTIIGIDNFRSWLRGYGSSVIVIKPKWLATEMIESVQKVLDLYKD